MASSVDARFPAVPPGLLDGAADVAPGRLINITKVAMVKVRVALFKVLLPPGSAICSETLPGPGSIFHRGSAIR